MAQQYSDTAPGSFHDFTAHFSAVEWKLLHKWQTELYEAVMKEIHKTITCLGPTIATSIFALRPKAREEPPLVDHQDSKMSDSRNHFLRHDNVAPVTLFSNTDDSETCFMDQQETKNWCAPISQTEKADTSSVVSFKIKEENEPYFVDFQDSGQRESFTGDRTMKRKMNYIESVECTEEATSVGKRKVKGNKIKGFQKQKDAERHLVYKCNFDVGGGMSTLCDNEFPKKGRKSNPNLCPQKASRAKETKCDTNINHTQGPTENPESQEGFEDVNPEPKMSYQSNECEQTVDQLKYQSQKKTTLIVERYYSCPQCNKRFPRMSKLIRHQVTHTKEKAFQCTECGKSYNRNDSLVRHQRSHTIHFHENLEMWSPTVIPYNLQN
ncbi:zinc finger protein 431-like isoform X1 [Ambystoma mexicanum]|uniref:zinc finger protein 431-like isoform X1 n=1 Tax=Ambystoma mexicanum TaxID=8296 RepID=UPI0037E895BE